MAQTLMPALIRSEANWCWTSVDVMTRSGWSFRIASIFPELNPLTLGFFSASGGGW